MKRIILLLLFLLLALTACTGSGGTVEETEATPTVRPTMEATDPTTFVRAAGYPQFVEFFAFW